MELRLERKWIKPSYVIGRLYIDGKFFSNTLERPNRDLNKNGKFDNGEYKVYGNTCIPFGRYRIILNYSPKFKRVLPLLLDVPEFSGVRIHRGNTVKDTIGCILVGENKEVGKVINSTIYETRLIEAMTLAIKKGETCWINIV